MGRSASSPEHHAARTGREAPCTEPVPCVWIWGHCVPRGTESRVSAQEPLRPSSVWGSVHGQLPDSHGGAITQQARPQPGFWGRLRDRRSPSLLRAGCSLPPAPDACRSSPSHFLCFSGRAGREPPAEWQVEVATVPHGPSETREGGGWESWRLPRETPGALWASKRRGRRRICWSWGPSRSVTRARRLGVTVCGACAPVLTFGFRGGARRGGVGRGPSSNQS